ncbi:hypothetical protein D3C75_1113960 [compost metagenome]
MFTGQLERAIERDHLKRARQQRGGVLSGVAQCNVGQAPGASGNPGGVELVLLHKGV